MVNPLRSRLDRALPFFSEDLKWVVLFAAFITGVSAALAADVYLKLAHVRPLLVFVLVDGERAPICGFCVLFGG